MNFLYLVAIIALFLIGSVVVTTQNVPYTTRLSISAQLRFLHWLGQDGDCSDTSIKCEEYFETVHYLPCYLVYGHRDFGTDDWIGHIWNIVMIDGVPHEFESQTLIFKEVSEEYTIQTMQEGFYVDGVEYEKSQELDNWRELI